MCPVDGAEVSRGLVANGLSDVQGILSETARCQMIARSARMTLSAWTHGGSALEAR